NNGKNHVITSAIEHPAVLNACKWLEKRGFKVTYLPVDQSGRINPADLKSAVSKQTCLVSVMHANNETGAIQPIAEMVPIAHDAGAYFHTDGVQALGKIPVDVDRLGVDLFTVSAHKVYGPKGAGALYVRKGVSIESLVHGGGHEYGLRSGTENLSGIAGFGAACDMLPAVLDKMPELETLRDYLESGIRKLVPEYRLNGPRNNRLANTLNVTLPGYRGESVVVALGREGVYCSSGSACHAGSPDPSHALLEMGLPASDAHCALRFSLGENTSRQDIADTIAILGEIFRESKSMVHFVPCR
ncbi:MAG: cysteine desulfurase family protein, partial [Desulfosalsimonadaceae bacterium]